MRKVILISFSLFFIFSLKSSHALEFKRIGEIIDSDLYSIAVTPLDGNIYFAGSDNALFRKKAKDSWQTIYTVTGYRTKVNYIYISPYKTVYIATGSGLLKTSISGSDFRKIYKGADSKENVVYHVKLKDDTIYIGTAKGLFFSPKDNISWQKVSILPNDIEVYWIEFDSKYADTAYIATSLGVYKIDDNFKNIEKVFFTQDVEIPDSEDEDELLIEETEYYSFLPKVLHIDNKYNNKIYLGTSDGFFISDDGGAVWNKVLSSQLAKASIRDIYQDQFDNYIYLATDKGFFRLDLAASKITQIYKGLTTNNINFIASYTKDEFLLATDKGLFETDFNFGTIELSNENQERFKYEPSIGEVMKAAIRYNDVSAEKIRRWQEVSKKKALLPDLRVGVDKDIDEQYHWAGVNDYHLVAKGPDEKDFGWDVSLSWDLGDLIWSTAQTSIDVRARLNTQLRIDILEEVNRLYFERYRLKMQLLSSPPKNEQNRIEQQLRLKEMTARLDLYTGGFFSRRIKQMQMADK